MREPVDLHIPWVRFVVLTGLPTILLFSTVSLFLPEKQAALWTDATIPLSALVSLILCFLTLFLYRNHNLKGLFLGVFLNVLLSLAAEVIWSYHDLVLRSEPSYPSIADAFWLAGYLPLSYAFLRMRSLAGRGKNYLVYSATIFILTSSLAILLFPRGKLFEDLLSATYIACDLIVLSLILPLVVFYLRKGLGVSWLLILFSVISYSCGDILFAVSVAKDNYRVGTLPDFFYSLDYLLMSAGLLIHIFLHKNYLSVEPMSEKRVSHEREPLSSGSAIVVEGSEEEALRIFLDHVRSGMHGIYVTRTYPDLLKREHELEAISMLWLSSIERRGAVHPSDPAKILYHINDFMSRFETSVVLFGGMEYLVVQNGFESTLRFLHFLKNLVVSNKSRLIVSLNREAFSSAEYSLIEREIDMAAASPPLRPKG